MEKKILVVFSIILLVITISFVLINNKYFYFNYFPRKSVQGVNNVLKSEIEPKLVNYFNEIGFMEFPDKVSMIVLKSEKIMEVWGKHEGDWKKINEYEIKAASGVAGPKLREGDRQVPEGIYRIIALNPNSSYHLSMKMNYPNEFDLEKARKENRVNPGGNIFIHGKAVSIGCVAVGDEAIEELFYLVSKVGIENTRVVSAPYDFRKKQIYINKDKDIDWLDELYTKIDEELGKFTK